MRIFLLITILVGLTAVSIGASRQSANYSLEKETWGAAGGESQAGAARLRGTLAQPGTVGPRQSSTYSEQAGFWHSLGIPPVVPALSAVGLLVLLVGLGTLIRHRRMPAALTAILLLLAALPAGAVPLQINYQGKIDVNGAPFDEEGLFAFALVDGGGTVDWSSDGTTTPTADVALQVDDGLFQVMLGDDGVMGPIPGWVFGQDELYLRVWFDDGVNGQQQLVPDQRLGSSGFAVVAGTAEDAEMLDGQAPTYYRDWDYLLDIPSGFADGDDDDRPDSDAEVPDSITVDNGRLYAPAGAGNVGIGTTSPDSQLHVDGTLTVQRVIRAAGSNGIRLADSGLNSLVEIEETGQVGIGTDIPNSRLQVDSETGEDPLRVQVNGSSKLFVGSNGGTSIG